MPPPTSLITIPLVLFWFSSQLPKIARFYTAHAIYRRLFLLISNVGGICCPLPCSPLQPSHAALTGREWRSAKCPCSSSFPPSRMPQPFITFIRPNIWQSCMGLALPSSPSTTSIRPMFHPRLPSPPSRLTAPPSSCRTCKSACSRPNPTCRTCCFSRISAPSIK